MADEEDYERFWKEVRPNRRSGPPTPPEASPRQALIPQWVTDHEAAIRDQGLPEEQSEPLQAAHIRNLEYLLGVEQLHHQSPVAQAIQQENRVDSLLNRVEQRQFHASWVNQEISNSPQLTNLVNAFTALGIPIDVFLELQDDQQATSTLEITLDNQTIRIESANGINTVRVFDRIDRL